MTNIVSGVAIDSTIGKVCFICYFLEGSQSQGCYIEYKCIDADYNVNITIERTTSNANNATILFSCCVIIEQKQ